MNTVASNFGPIVALRQFLLILSLLPVALLAQQTPVDIQIIDTNFEPRDPAFPLQQQATKSGLVVYYGADEEWGLPDRLEVYDGKSEVFRVDMSDYRDAKPIQTFRDGVVFKTPGKRRNDEQFVYYDVARQKFHTFYRPRRLGYINQPFVTFRGRLFFIGDDKRLYISDGTERNTHPIPKAGTFGSYFFLEEEMVFRDSLYFSGTEASFVTDGTLEGTDRYSHSEFENVVIYKDQIFEGSDTEAAVGKGSRNPRRVKLINRNHYISGTAVADSGVVYATHDEHYRYSFRSWDGSDQGFIQLFDTLLYNKRKHPKLWSAGGKAYFLMGTTRSWDEDIYLYVTDGTKAGTKKVSEETYRSRYTKTLWADEAGNAIQQFGDRTYSFTVADGGKLRRLKDASGANYNIRDPDQWRGPIKGRVLTYKKYGNSKSTTFTTIDLATGTVREITKEMMGWEMRLPARRVGDQLLVATRQYEPSDHNSGWAMSLLDPFSLTLGAMRYFNTYAFEDASDDRNFPPMGQTGDGRTLFFSDDFYWGHSIMEVSPTRNEIRVAGDIYPHNARMSGKTFISSSELPVIINDHILASHHFLASYKNIHNVHHYKLGSDQIDTFNFSINNYEYEILGSIGEVMLRSHKSRKGILEMIDLRDGSVAIFKTFSDLTGYSTAIVGQELFYKSVRTPSNQNTIASLRAYNIDTGQDRLIASLDAMAPHGAELTSYIANYDGTLYFTWINPQGRITLHQHSPGTEGITQLTDADLTSGDEGALTHIKYHEGIIVYSLRLPYGVNKSSTYYLIDLSTNNTHFLLEERAPPDYLDAGLRNVKAVPDYWIIRTGTKIYSVDRSDFSVQLLDEDHTPQGRTMNDLWVTADGKMVIYQYTPSGVSTTLRLTDGTPQGTTTIYTGRYFNSFSNGLVTVISESLGAKNQLLIYDHSTSHLEKLDLIDLVGSHSPFHLQPFMDGFFFTADNDILGREPHLLNVTGVKPILSSTTGESAKSMDLVVVPNPTDGRVRVLTSVTGPLSATLFSATGATLLQQAGYDEMTIDLTAFPAGIYYLSVIQTDGKHVGHTRIVRQ